MTTMLPAERAAFAVCCAAAVVLILVARRRRIPPADDLLSQHHPDDVDCTQPAEPLAGAPDQTLPSPQGSITPAAHGRPSTLALEAPLEATTPVESTSTPSAASASAPHRRMTRPLLGACHPRLHPSPRTN